ncbi:hypothetical protein DdX_05289 [Ditylenchus destructor]|uniref:Uncharacterized protein n=1 Tax=Ditylenchus destructor TaxID=166010 RepID=A0AAD4N5Y9_9BILA|nr:hypothetical protein DdX_05289 [Ditylenchus destructor]
MLDWWYELLPRWLQDQWIGLSEIDASQLRDAYAIYKQKKNLLSLEFLDAYLPTQPNLLCALTILGLFSAIILLFFLVVVIAKKLGACGAYQSSSQKSISGSCRFRTICVFTVICWSVMMGVTFILIGCLMDFGSKSIGGSAASLDDGVYEVDKPAFQGIKTQDRHVLIGVDSVIIKDDGTHGHQESFSGVSESHMLQKYNDVRELGYEFKPLDRDSENFLKYFACLLLLIFYIVCLIASALAVIAGLKEQFQTYHLMEHKTTNSDRAGRTLMVVAFIMFALTPLVNFFSAMLLVQTHAHSIICPYEQTTSQNANIEDYINENYNYFESTSLVDFLGDLSKERVDINQGNCDQHAQPMRGVWASFMVLSWISLPAIFFFIQLSKYFMKGNVKRKSKGVDFSTYAQPNGFDAYSIYESKNMSPYTFGTFVYKKY